MSVKTKYGPPQGGGSAHMQYSIATWRDQKNKNNVKYTVLDGVGCYVQYSAIKTGSRTLRFVAHGVAPSRLISACMPAPSPLAAPGKGSLCQSQSMR